MDISIFGEVKDNTDEKLVEIGVKYVYSYYAAQDEFKNDKTADNEVKEFIYGKMWDLMEQLTKNRTYIDTDSKIRAYRREIENMKKFGTNEVYKDIDNVLIDIDIVQNLVV